MKTTIIAASIACLLLITACYGNRKTITGDWAVTRAEQQGWSGGMPGSGTGINFRIHVAGSGVADVVFDTVWHDSRAYIPEVHVEGNEAQLQFNYHRFPADRDDPLSGMVEVPPVSQGPDFEGEALIIFRKDGKRYTYPVNKLQRLEYLDYP